MRRKHLSRLFLACLLSYGAAAGCSDAPDVIEPGPAAGAGGAAGKEGGSGGSAGKASGDDAGSDDDAGAGEED